MLGTWGRAGVFTLCAVVALGVAVPPAEAGTPSVGHWDVGELEHRWLEPGPEGRLVLGGLTSPAGVYHCMPNLDPYPDGDWDGTYLCYGTDVIDPAEGRFVIEDVEIDSESLGFDRFTWSFRGTVGERFFSCTGLGTKFWSEYEYEYRYGVDAACTLR